MEKINQEPISPSSFYKREEPGSLNSRQGPFSAALSKFIEKEYSKLLKREIFGGNIPKLPKVPKNPGKSAPKVEQEIYFLSLLLWFYEQAKEGFATDPKILEAAYNQVKSLFAGTDLGESLDKLIAALKSAKNPSEDIKDFEDAKIDFFGSLAEWFNSDLEKSINQFLNDPSISRQNKASFETAFINIMIDLMDSKTFNMNSGLDKLFFGFLNANLGASFPELLYYAAYENALATGVSKQEAIIRAKGFIQAVIASMPPKNPLGPNVPTPNYNHLVDYLKNFDFHMPSPEEVDIDLQLIQQAIGNFLGS